MSAKNTPGVAKKIEQLNELVEWFDSEKFALEEAMAKFKAAEKLAGEIEHDLMTMKNEIEVVKQRFDEEG